MEQRDHIKDAILKDLELQWNDHFHMRDQTWKTLTNAALLFVGVIGLEIKNLGNLVMIPAYFVLLLTAIFGWTVATHHRVRQKQKFAFIKIYEEKLGIFELKRKILEDADAKGGVADKIFTAGSIEMMHIGIGIVAFILLIRRIFDLA